MDLIDYEGKTVRLTDTDGEIYEGYAADYVFADDNEPVEVDAIILDYPVRESDGYKYETPVEFTEPEIHSIEMIDS